MGQWASLPWPKYPLSFQELCYSTNLHTPQEWAYSLLDWPTTSEGVSSHWYPHDPMPPTSIYILSRMESSQKWYAHPNAKILLIEIHTHQRVGAFPSFHKRKFLSFFWRCMLISNCCLVNWQALELAFAISKNLMTSFSFKTKDGHILQTKSPIPTPYNGTMQ